MMDHKQWYLDNKPKYELLLNRVIGLTDILLRREKIKFYKIQSRVKDFDSFKVKFSNKIYREIRTIIRTHGVGI